MEPTGAPEVKARTRLQFSAVPSPLRHISSSAGGDHRGMIGQRLLAYSLAAVLSARRGKFFGA
jgi:hypothetical protein